MINEKCLSEARRNFLEKVLAVQTDYLHEKSKTRLELTSVTIWRNVIKPKYFISQKTLSRYLTINTKRELQKLDALKNA